MHDLVGDVRTFPLIALRTAVVYLVVLAGFRLSGKREVGQLSPFDFALILLIANAVQNAMVGPDTSLLGGIVAALVLLLLNYALSFITRRDRRLGRFLRGQPRILIWRGKLDDSALRAEDLSHDTLFQALRENGCATPGDCKLAVLEVDGTISVIPHAHRS